MIGEALRRDTYHTGKTRQENFIRKIWINTICLRNLDHQETAANLLPKNRSHETHHSCRSLSDFSESSFSLEEPSSAVPRYIIRPQASASAATGGRID